MSTLTDRYVWAVLRAVPEWRQADLEPEIRALVAGAVELRAFAASAGSAALDHAAVERAALIALGDPELLAARYADRSAYLIGPAYYSDYRRLLKLLLGIVVPLAILAALAVGFLAGMGIAEVALNGIVVGLGVGICLAAWITLAFALVERNDTRRSGPLGSWTPDRLPKRPPPNRLGAGEVVASLSSSVLLLGVILASGAEASSDAALGTTWFAWFVGVAVLEIAFTVLVFASRRWTWPIAIINAVLGTAFAIPAVWLLQTGQLIGPDLEAEIARVGAGPVLAPSVALAGVAILGVVAWDVLDGFRRARHTHGGD